MDLEELNKKIDDLFMTWQRDRQDMWQYITDINRRLDKFEAAISELMIQAYSRKQNGI